MNEEKASPSDLAKAKLDWLGSNALARNVHMLLGMCSVARFCRLELAAPLLAEVHPTSSYTGLR